MQDDFDNGMGLPDDELGGGSAMSDMGEHGAGHEGETEAPGAPAGRPSGGARARKSSARKSAAAPKPSAGRKMAAGKKKGAMAKAAKKKGGARKASKKAPKRKAGRKK
jgi:hypothetical protein